MLATGLKYFTDTPLTVIGLFIFITVFSGITMWTFMRRRSRQYYRKMSQMPLDEGDKNER